MVREKFVCHVCFDPLEIIGPWGGGGNQKEALTCQNPLIKEYRGFLEGIYKESFGCRV